jgi:hypothetical protein
VFICADFLYALITEVRADGDVGLNRISVAPDTSDEIKVKSGTASVALSFENYFLGRFYAVVRI